MTPQIRGFASSALPSSGSGQYWTRPRTIGRIFRRLPLEHTRNILANRPRDAVLGFFRKSRDVWREDHVRQGFEFAPGRRLGGAHIEGGAANPARFQRIDLGPLLQSLRPSRY